MSPTTTQLRMKTVFCEGKEESLDSVFLNRVCDGLPSNFKIRSCGGKRGINAYVEGYFRGEEVTNDQVLIFRDRDFDVEPPSEISLIRDGGGKPKYMTYRACIESYFIDATLIRRYWEEMSAGPKWAHGDPPEKDALETQILNSAQAISDYQAVRWALAALKPGARWPEMSTHWTNKSGDLPDSLTLDECREMAIGMIKEYRSSTDSINVDMFEKKCDEYSRRFGKEGFWSNADYLVWFHGKDLMKSLQREMNNSFPRREYLNWAAENIEWQSFADLIELRNLVASTN